MSTANARAIRQLLAFCVRPGECELPANEAEWDALLPLALAHGVAPMLFANLRERVLPVRARDQLRLVYLSNSFRNEKLLAEQHRILDAFSKKSLAAWPLKGPHLSEHLYGDPAVRQVADLDLLIRPEDLAACDDVLHSLGYARQAQGEIAELRGAGELLYLKQSQPEELSKDRERFVGHGFNRVESLAPGEAPSGASAPEVPASGPLPTFAVDLQQRVLPYGQRDPLAGRIRALGLTPENLLLLLCVNQIAHRFARLKYLLDVAACLRKLPGNFDWKNFTATARLLDFTPGIYWSLAWARAVAAAPVPESVLETLRPGWFSRKLAARALGADPVAPLARGAALDGPAGAWAILVCTRPGLAPLRQFWSLLFPPSATLRQEFFATPNRPILYLYLARLARKLPAALRPRKQ
ncbi:MAG: nucleotidyltransferase family protein [Acidobacteria bacterium]|nr:nucleotidyltransferase family protein [Acidobacteriota bacterium]